MTEERASEPNYPLEQSNEEMRRLALQSEVLHTQPTRWLFEQAGLSAGMRVLDVGCGAGDVSFLAAEMVGPSGTVVGVDSSPRALETARARAARAGLTNVSFVEGDLRSLEIEGGFDALVGRSVLMYFEEPAAVLRGLVRFVRPGGVVAFREMVLTEEHFQVFPACDLIEELNALYVEHQGKFVPHGLLGLQLAHIFVDAGLPSPQMWMHAPLGSDAGWPGWEYLVQQLRVVESLSETIGVTLPAGLDATQFVEQVRAHVLSHRGVLRLQRGVQAWARTRPADV